MARTCEGVPGPFLSPSGSGRRTCLVRGRIRGLSSCPLRQESHPGEGERFDLGRTVREPGVQVHVAGDRRYAWGVGSGGVHTGERIVLACPNGRCGERVVLAGRNGLWYGRSRPETFS